MYFIGQKWEDTPWGTVEIVWIEEVPGSTTTVKVEYATNGERWGNPVLVHLNCERCMAFPIGVPHDNCRHPDRAGHSKTHCTASACF